MMGVSPAGRYNFLPNFCWEGDVHQVVAMNVADLPPADPVFYSAKPVWMGGNTGLIRHCLINLVLRILYGHVIFSIKRPLYRKRSKYPVMSPTTQIRLIYFPLRFTAEDTGDFMGE